MTRLREAALSAFVLAALLTLGGCDSAILDPTADPYTWRSEGVNEQNIAAQVANPDDLAAPHGDESTGGGESVASIRRLRASAGLSLDSAGPGLGGPGLGASGSGAPPGGAEAGTSFTPSAIGGIPSGGGT